MKLLLYPKGLLEAAWCKDKKHYADGDTADSPKCLRCGAPLAPHLMVNALSRYVDVQICEACGMDEALRDAELLLNCARRRRVKSEEASNLSRWDTVSS